MARILIVDDVAGVREFCAYVMSDRGHEVFVAESGRVALKLFEEKLPDLVFLDVDMPEMDGLATLAAMLAIDPAVRVCMLTGRREESIVRRALTLGARDYVVKPIHGSRLELAVERLLGHAQAKES